MNDLNELQFFVFVARTGSFTQAAERLGVPKSAVSRGISHLEHRLGIQLMQRTTRRVLLTEAGKLFLHHAERALAEVEQAGAAAANLQLNPRGHLRIGSPSPFAKDFIAPLLASFLREYPELQVHLVLAGGWVVYAGPFQMDLDLLIQVGGEVEDPCLYVKLLGRIGRALYASPAYLEAHGTPSLPSDLPKHSCITVGERGGHAMWRLRNGAEVLDVALNPHLSVNEPTITSQLALDGVGIAMVDDWMIPTIPAAALVRVLPHWEPESVNIYALYPSRLGLSTKVRVFIEFLEKHFPQEIRQARSHPAAVVAGGS